MIDLRNKGLPNTIEVGGSLFHIKTDFRLWITFGELIKKKDCSLHDVDFLFVNKIPKENFSKQLMDFYLNKNATPNYNSNDDEKVIDFILDGEYIVASFMKEYKIDLTSCDMHWHLFKSLFIGLSDQSKIKQIIASRSYKKSSKSQEQVLEENKLVWRLPVETPIEQDELLEEINKKFYNS